ncbi:MAG: cell division protein PerM [Actinomycetota bacterium]
MSLEGPPAPPPTPPTSPTADRARLIAQQARSALRSGWGSSAIAAVVVLAIVLVLNVLLAWLQQEAVQRLLPAATSDVAAFAKPGLGRIALLSHMFWHGVAIDVEIALPAGQVPFGSSIQASLTATFMLGFAITGYLLFRAGRWVAEKKGEAGWLSVTDGLQIALIYAVLGVLLALLARWEVPLPVVPGGDGPSSVSIAPSLLGAFWLPFLLAAFAAGAGALNGRLQPRERIRRLALSAVSGGWRAAWLAVALASIGFLIVAALNPDVTRAYLNLLPGGGLSRAVLVISTLLLVPNMGTGIAAAAMGGSINIATQTQACAVISYFQFPGGIVEPGPGVSPAELACGLPIDLGPAPFQYLLFLLVPLAATFAGGWFAAQRSGATELEEGAMSGLTIALPFALWLWALALFARIGGSTSFFAFVSESWVGPGLLSTVLVALAWGAIGGAIGGAFGARNASGPGINPSPQAEVSA